MYNQDKLTFGDPADTGRKTAEIKDLDNWQVVLQAHTKSVESSRAKNAKRKEVPS
jgi:hypothetical protein